MEEEIVNLKMKIVKNIIYVYRIVNAIIAGKNALKRLITIKKGKERQKIAETRGKIFMDIGIYIYIRFDDRIHEDKLRSSYDREMLDREKFRISNSIVRKIFESREESSNVEILFLIYIVISSSIRSRSLSNLLTSRYNFHSFIRIFQRIRWRFINIDIFF